MASSASCGEYREGARVFRRTNRAPFQVGLFRYSGTHRTSRRVTGSTIASKLKRALLLRAKKLRKLTTIAYRARGQSLNESGTTTSPSQCPVRDCWGSMADENPPPDETLTLRNCPLPKVTFGISHDQPTSLTANRLRFRISKVTE